MATPRVAAGALFFDDEGRVLLVRPTYKPHWDIPGGYVEPGESPRASCIREIHEELGLAINVGRLLVVDWAPAPTEGDKLLFIFDGGNLTNDQISRVTFGDGELVEFRFIDPGALSHYGPDRLTRRIQAAYSAREQDGSFYAEHGRPC